MEYGLGRYPNEKGFLIIEVLILVLMEYGLGHRCGLVHRYVDNRVLILVLMEYGLGRSSATARTAETS